MKKERPWVLNLKNNQSLAPVVEGFRELVNID